MSRVFSRFFAAALIAVSGSALVISSFDADAARLGGGGSVGRQSTNIGGSRPATSTSPTATQKSATPAAAAAPAGAAAKPAGASRWLGPLAGIAAGLGIGALLSHFGMSGAFGSFLVMALLAGLVVFAIMFVVRLLRGGSAQPSLQGAGAPARAQPTNETFREVAPQASAATSAPLSAAGFGGSPVQTPDQNWFIPGDFDSSRFLQEAKQQFVAIQKVWDSGDVSQLRNFLTDDLMKELETQLSGRGGVNQTEVVLLNAEMLGIEQVTDGHLASVRFSGMLREQVGAEAFRFEEVWNLFKPTQGGWLLAGIQQIPVSQAS